MGEGKLPALKSQNLANAEKQAAKSAGKSSTAKPPKELDENGQPIKKVRQKRAPKPVEEVTIYFRIKTQAEKLAEENVDPGFPPTPPESDNEAEAAPAEDEEEKAQNDEQPAANEEHKGKEGAQAQEQEENPEQKAKIFDH